MAPNVGQDCGRIATKWLEHGKNVAGSLQRFCSKRTGYLSELIYKDDLYPELGKFILNLMIIKIRLGLVLQFLKIYCVWFGYNIRLLAPYLYKKYILRGNKF